MTTDKCIPENFNKDLDGWEPADKVNQFTELKTSIPGYPEMTDDTKHLYVELAELRTDIIYRYNNILLLDSGETERNYFEEYISFLEEDNLLESKKIILATLYSHGLYERAKQYIDLIPGESASDFNFLAYYNVLLDLKLEDKNVFQMSDNQIEVIRGLAQNNDAVSYSAQGILTLVFGENYERMPDAPVVEDVDQNGEENPEGGSADYTLLMYPNPTVLSSTPNLNIEYEIAVPFQTASLIILNGIGEPVYNNTIQVSDSANGSIQIPTESFTYGLYVTQLVLDGAVVSYKLLNLLP